MLEIRNLVVNDGAALSSIAESVRFAPGTADGRQGYLVYVGTPEEYAARLAGASAGYLALWDGKAVGYLLVTPSAGDTATHAGSEAVMARVFGEGTWLVDQIGIREEGKGKGIGVAMLGRFFSEMAPQRATAVIMHGPMRNERSIGFFAGKNGFRCIGEYSEGDGMFWGVYEWKADGSQGEAAYPLGRFLWTDVLSEADAAARTGRIGRLPGQMRETVTALGEARLDEAIRPGAWTARQVLHHAADTATVLCERIRLALTEERPAIKTFEEDLWVRLSDARSAPAEESLSILDGVLGRMARLLATLPAEAYQRELTHPRQGILKLDRVCSYLDWHGRHHSAQIRALLG
jgi:GNAT superfamily N-acetyltransferase